MCATLIDSTQSPRSISRSRGRSLDQNTVLDSGGLSTSTEKPMLPARVYVLIYTLHRQLTPDVGIIRNDSEESTSSYTQRTLDGSCTGAKKPLQVFSSKA